MRWKLLPVLLLIPALLLLLLSAFSRSALGGYSHGAKDSSSSCSSYTEEEIEHCYKEMPEISDWMDESREKDPEGVYVFHYQEDMEEVELDVYLIYRPSAGYMRSIEDKSRKGKGFSKDIMELSFVDTDDPGWSHAHYLLTCLTHYGSDIAGLDILVNGEKVDYEMKEINFNPAPEEAWDTVCRQGKFSLPD